MATAGYQVVVARLMYEKDDPEFRAAFNTEYGYVICLHLNVRDILVILIVILRTGL